MHFGPILTNLELFYWSHSSKNLPFKASKIIRFAFDNFKYEFKKKVKKSLS
jgi:hypothetical protein